MARSRVDIFMDGASALVADRGLGPATYEAIGGRLRALAEHVDLAEKGVLRNLHGTAAATILGRHPDGSVLMLARFSPESPTPVHNHNSWGVVCVVRGRDLYQRWERLDDGTLAHLADLRLAEERTLETRDVVWFEGPPQDLHAQQGVGDAVWELAYFGRDPNAAPRAYFDPGTGIVTFDSPTR
jgi:3-mercaptopropionate dioxygenase